MRGGEELSNDPKIESEAAAPPGCGRMLGAPRPESVECGVAGEGKADGEVVGGDGTGLGRGEGPVEGL